MGNHFIERVVKLDQISQLKSIHDLINYCVERANIVLRRINHAEPIPRAKLGYLRMNTKSGV